MRGFQRRASVDEALSTLASRSIALDAERVPVTEASGRVLAEDVCAAVSVPHFRRAAMDGWAVVGESTFGASTYAPASLVLIGEARPGRPFAGALRHGEAVRITTGAPVPEGADAVLMAERAEEITRGDRTIVSVVEPVSPGKHVGAVGEDVPAGSIVARRGRKLRPQDVGLLASVGAALVPVVARPRVRVVITGDELLAPGQMPEGSCIVDSNSVVLAALVARDGGALSPTVRAADRYELVREAIAAGDEDVVLVSGGSSVGPEDHAPLALAEIGELTVHGVAMRPSSPAGFGFIAGKTRERTVFLLPGNPVSCLCAYEFFAGPTIRALGGLPRAWPHRRARGRLAAKIVSELGRVDYVRVAYDGARVTPIMTSGASILSSTTRADGVVLVSAGSEGHAEDEEVEVFLYD
ncbi:molybdopterin molybdenumtransferase MoeA [Polyangium spumosum]|uniref:Molybdopterin molybdenumtransferase n=2 Tax=Polyangium spumosum TaxID=889282 RepID=A0A6N7PVV3_9BACT|nr:molybdopterin molybdenumtransferase MoeA [Polyangium spumosum]